MTSDNNKISERQSSIFIVLYIFSSASVLMPIFCIHGAGTQCWIASLTASLMFFFPILLIYGILRQNGSFYEILSSSVGKYISKFYYSLFIVKSIISTALLLKIFSETVHIFLLEKTPLWLTSFIMLTVCAYAASKGIEAIGRLGEILIILVCIPFFMVFIAACFSVKPENFQKIFDTDIYDTAKTSFIAFLSFASADCIAMLLPYAADKKNSSKKMFVSAAVGMFTASAAIFIAIGCFGVYAATKQSAILPEIMNTIKLPPVLLERHDLLNMFFWIMLLFQLISSFVFFTCTAVKNISKKNKKSYMLWVIPFIYALTFVPIKLSSVYLLLGITNAFGNILFISISIAAISIINIKVRNHAHLK